MSFAKLRSLTPGGSRRRRQSSNADSDPVPSSARQLSPARSAASSTNRGGSAGSSVNLDRDPALDRGRYRSSRTGGSTSFSAQVGNPSSSSTNADYAAPQSTAGESRDPYDTDATSIHTLAALQTKGPGHEYASLEPVIEDDPASYDLVAPPEPHAQATYSLEKRGEQIFSVEHLQAIFDDPTLLVKFTTYLGLHRPQSVPLLIFYLDALKALSAIKYANAVAEALEPLRGLEFTLESPPATENSILESKARQAFEIIARDDLPAFVTHTWIQVVSVSINKRITGSMPPHLREMSEGLAEVFCLTDPSRPDNPIVFASEEFYRTTQYGVSYAIGRNCRFLQGPCTNRDTVRRIREAVDAGRDLCETFVNYRRDGSPFMNLLMMAPLRDGRGNLRYFIGAQVDVSGLAKECTELEAVQRMLAAKSDDVEGKEVESRDEFQELSEMFNQAELEIVRKAGGRMHQERVEEADDTGTNNWHRPRLLLKDPTADDQRQPHASQSDGGGPSKIHGKLLGVYQHYLLVRPYPSLRILFASPSLRVPGILQSPFMNRIGSSERVREELISALAEGRGVTAKIRWVNKHQDEGRNRWIHCTPLMGGNGSIGVWMIVLVDEEGSKLVRRFREAPPVSKNIGDGDAGERRNQTMTSRPQSGLAIRDGTNNRASSAMGTYGRPSATREDDEDDFNV